MTPSGIEPATFRLVAQCLNQLRHRVQVFKDWYVSKISHWYFAEHLQIVIASD
jgi:hypothetical protein